MELPKMGDRISVDKLFVSKMNVRVNHAFGVVEQDEVLTKHLSGNGIVQPFVARPEDDGYGVVIGRRRFLAKKTSGVKEFVVGEDCLIKEMDEAAAFDSSLRENLQIFQKELDPMTRAESINALMGRRALGLRGLARKWNMPHATLSEWLRLVDLKSARMRAAVRDGLVSFRDALQVAKLNLEEAREAELAETAEMKGVDAFKGDLARLMAGKGKRGIPAGIYLIDRVVWDKRDREESSYHETLRKASESKNMKVPEYIKEFIISHIKEIEKETA